MVKREVSIFGIKLTPGNLDGLELKSIEYVGDVNLGCHLVCLLRHKYIIISDYSFIVFYTFLNVGGVLSISLLKPLRHVLVYLGMIVSL